MLLGMVRLLGLEVLADGFSRHVASRADVVRRYPEPIRACALAPCGKHQPQLTRGDAFEELHGLRDRKRRWHGDKQVDVVQLDIDSQHRSEERRVGKECRSRWS